MAEIVIPNVGIAMEEALIVKWLKQPGEDVVTDEPVLEIETDKTTMDIVSPASGTLGAHLFDPGAVVPVGTAVAHVVGEGEPVEAVVAPRSNDAAALAASDDQPTGARPTRGMESAEGERRPHALSPRARRLAEARGAEPESTPSGGRFRELIAAKVSESWREIPHFAVSREVDAEPMLATLDQLRTGGLEPSPTLTDLLLRSLALALRETGHTGSSDVGLAVATPHGVVIPVVRDVIGQDAAALASARSSAIERARAGRRCGSACDHTVQPRAVRRRSLHRDHRARAIDLAHRRPRGSPRRRGRRSLARRPHHLQRHPQRRPQDG
jgi:pyruvate/2-oxoglutarate dehydrogenase complex dihydrolipoamide acyltransferase (E2) component